MRFKVRLGRQRITSWHETPMQAAPTRSGSRQGVGIVIFIVVPAEMVDAAACTAMELGAPRASVPAPAELHLQLSERADFDEASPVFKLQTNNPMTHCLRTKVKPLIAVPSRPPAPQQLSMSLESAVPQEQSSIERAARSRNWRSC